MSLPLPKLQTALAHAGVASRRKAEELIAAGRIAVNGETARLGQRVDPATDQVTQDGQPLTLTAETHSYYLVYKPVGVVSTTSDELGRTNIIEYLSRQLPTTNTLNRLYPVGRLDLESEGLMLLTNDGDLAHRLTHPSFEVNKTYRVTVIGQPSEKAVAHLARGIRLVEGFTAPATVTPISMEPIESVLDITIHEGRHQQVRRMFDRVGYPVTKLIRTHLGPFQLEDLKDQTFRELTATEVEKRLGLKKAPTAQ